MPAAAQQAYGHAPIATVQRTTPSQSSHMPVEAKPHAQPLPPNTVAAVVIGHEKDGTNILHTKLGVVKMMTPTPLPMHAGATLQIQADDLPPLPSLPTLLTPEELAALSTRSRDWPQLEEAVSWLNVHDAPAARDVMQAIPQVGAKLTSGLIFFMVAVKGGDLKQWIGSKALARLEASAPDIASKLKGDMAQLQQLLLHSPLEQWSGAMIPLLYQGELSYTKLYLRDEQQGEPEKAQGKGGQRFILEVELSHLGEMQLDGFVQGPTNKKQFDLIIRTSKTLPNDVSQEIRTLFDTALKTTGYQGYLGFQHGSQHFVRPLAAGGPGENPPHHQTILA
jgi:hypothetical protein